MDAKTGNGVRRVAIVQGLRTPFAKAGTTLAHFTALDLGQRVVRELVERADLDPKAIDQLASQLGITVGNTYPLDVFHAERHTTESNFRIETTIGCLTPVTIN